MHYLSQSVKRLSWESQWTNSCMSMAHDVHVALLNMAFISCLCCSMLHSR